MRAASPSVRILTLALAAALSAVATWWTLQLVAPRAAIAPAASAGDGAAFVDLASASRLFGGTAPAAGQAAAGPPPGIQVLGIASSRRGASVVLLVEGQPARAAAVGDTLPGGLKVIAVRPDAVVLERDGNRFEAPAPARASTDILTAGSRAATLPGASTPPAATAAVGGLPQALPGGPYPAAPGAVAGSVPGTGYPGAGLPSVGGPVPPAPPAINSPNAPSVAPPQPIAPAPVTGIPGASYPGQDESPGGGPRGFGG